MNAPSEIDQFITQLHAEGAAESGGEFSLSPEKALLKIAYYPRPFLEVWLAKVLQSGVVSSSPAISVRITKSETSLRFVGGDWSPETFEQAFYKPQGTGDPALDHLLLGLWYLAIGRDYPFSLSFAHQDLKLHWDGDRFDQTTLKGQGKVARCVPELENQAFLELSVPHWRVTQQCGWFERQRIRSQRTIDLTDCLMERAYVCSVPLYFEGRRIDSLDCSPMHGTTPQSAPFAAGSLADSLPPFRRPQAPGSAAFEQILESSGLSDSVSALWTASVHFEASPSNWKEKPTNSEIVWVKDGVVLARESLTNIPRTVAIAVYVSAEGLKTDLSGFKLVADESTELRKKSIRTGLQVGLQELSINIENFLLSLGEGRELFGQPKRVQSKPWALFSKLLASETELERRNRLARSQFDIRWQAKHGLQDLLGELGVRKA